MSVRDAYAELVYRGAILLDAGDHAGFLGLCAPDFQYTIGAYSPELRRPMVWLDHDRAALEHLFTTLPRHHSEPARLSRHVTVYTVQVTGDEAQIVSALQVFRTPPDGATELFAVGKIHDRARLDGGAARLVRRHVELETRLLGIGSHVPC
jgi:methanesulfonate monooxygenase subunit beta